MTEYQPAPKATQFIERLERLDSGERAKLKRNAGCRLAEARGVTTLFYRLLPGGIPAFQEEAYFMLATLFPMAEANGKGCFGDALRQARKDSNQKGLDRRVEALLDANQEQLGFRLRQAVHFLQSNRVRVNWPVLLDDLLHWEHPERKVQRRWAKAYFGLHDEESSETMSSPAEGNILQ